MPFLPVAQREAREASRQPRTYRWRWVTGAIGLGLLSFIFAVTRRSFSQGQELFIGLSVSAFIYCILGGAVRTADTIAEEKRENTLGLLFLTDLKGWDIIFGKLLSSSVNCVFGLLALFPMLAIPVLMGGVPLGMFGKMLLVLLNTLFLSISIGFLISSLFRQTLVTISGALLTMLFLGGGLPLAAVYAHAELHNDTLVGIIFVFSPLLGVINCLGNVPKELDYFWIPMLITHAMAWISLTSAVYFLPRFWQEVPKNKRTERWRERIRSWRFGQGKTKTLFRQRLLNQNPLFWLSNRERVSSSGLLIVITIILVGALIIAAINQGARPRNDEFTAIFFAGVAISHVMLAFRVAMAASSRLAEDRRSGALELLLGTELSIRELLRGHWMALRRQFFGPAVIVTLAALFGLFNLLLLFSHDYSIGNIWQTVVQILNRIINHTRVEEGWLLIIVIGIQGMLMLNWVAVTWVAMWLGLREKRAGVATWVSLAIVYVPPWILLIFGFASLAEAGAFNGVSDEVIIPCIITTGVVLGVSHALGLRFWAKRNLLRRFRATAADRFGGPSAFPWKAIGRFSLRFAGATALLIVIYVGLRTWIDRRGDRAWQAALAAHPGFAASYSTNVPVSIDKALNLADSDFFTQLVRQGPARKSITWNFAGAVSRGNEQLSWDWAQRHRMILDRVHRLYLERRLIATNATPPAKAILTALKTYENDLSMLRREAAARPHTRFEVPMTTFQINRPVFGWFPPNDPRDHVRSLIDTMSLLASARLADGENPIDDILLGLRLAEGFAHDPQSIIQYHEMRLSLTQPIYDGLTQHIWVNDDLKKIQDAFSNVDLWTGAEIFRADYIRRLVSEYDPTARRNPAYNRRNQNWLVSQLPTGLGRKRQADILEWGLTMTPKPVNLTARTIDQKLATQVQAARPDDARYARYPDQLLHTWCSLAFTQTTTDQIALACALERFRNDHQKIAATLDELVPNYISKIPHDVFTGQPLKYRPNENGNYVLYSIGSDNEDNNGVPTNFTGSWIFWQPTTSGDWVWNSEAIDPPPPKPKAKPRARKP